MAGHSKWSNIQGRKNAQDSKRGKIFQKISREIYMAVKKGGPDPNMNPLLRMVTDKAKSNNMPNDNIERAIKKGSSSTENENYDEVTYEGYGPNGVAVLVHSLTDNLNRTGTNLRVAFNKNGGAMGEKGSVSYLFERKGYMAIEREGLDVDEDTMLMSVLEAGGEEMEATDEVFEIYTDPSDFPEVRDSLKEEGYVLAKAEVTMIPQTTVELPENKKEIFEQMLDKLEDDDDVSEVFHNAEL